MKYNKLKKQNKVYFDGLNYEIVLKDKKNENNMGQILYKELIIEIDETMPTQLQKSVLMHECTHLILANLGETDLNNNEDFVERVSNAFFRLINENKEVFF